MDQPNAAIQKKAWEVVRRINAAWLERHTERLLDLFHDRVVIVGAGGQRMAEGKVACIASYRSFSDHASVGLYRESEAQIDVYDRVAVVSYRFEIEYTTAGKTSRMTGRDTFVLEKDGRRWLAVWRVVIS
jgi:ketosteroid isomerase-like protein